jgi:predicted Fe-Mo cluster-binding NifX family protein
LIFLEVFSLPSLLYPLASYLLYSCFETDSTAFNGRIAVQGALKIVNDAAASDDCWMKIAIPLFGNRVSPHFGASSRILLVTADKGNMIHRMILDSGLTDGWQLARHVAALEINTLVCGGIQWLHKEWLQRNGIEVLDNQSGLAEAVVAALLVSHVTVFKHHKPYQTKAR